MNNLITRDFHEVIGRVIPFEMNEDIRLGNALMDRIPTTQVQDLGIEEENTKSVDMSEFYNKLRFILPQKEEKQDSLILIEKMLIQNKDYWGLYDLFNEIEPYDKLPKLSVYSFCRNLVKKPILKNEYQKINQDIKSIKKSMKALEKKNFKKNNGKFNVKFK